MKTIEIKAREFDCAVEARQYASQSQGRAIRLAGRFYVITKDVAHTLETKGARFAYIHALPGVDKTVTVPVN